MVCQFTPLYENFREQVDSAKGKGDTCLYDALSKGCDELVEWKKKHSNSALRILCLSDGSDTCSKLQPYEVATKLQINKVVVDVIQIGQERDRDLRGIAKATSGFCFAPSSLSNALKLNELETLLCQNERPKRVRPSLVRSMVHLNRFASLPLDECHDDAVPQRKQPKEIHHPVCSLAKAGRSSETAKAHRG
eukprot:TRINITY_DN2659_c0_g1_i1.p1 TRINITY_DN2659_c0_g1~~TRINITY_DN2659_c0_g1_i1.p1  ORF type:complete len:192 (-),score=18.04 TRINITY_DN2659_c0_g1_i1:2-577(-)